MSLKLKNKNEELWHRFSHHPQYIKIHKYLQKKHNIKYDRYLNADQRDSYLKKNPELNQDIADLVYDQCVKLSLEDMFYDLHVLSIIYFLNGYVAANYFVKNSSPYGVDIMDNFNSMHDTSLKIYKERHKDCIIIAVYPYCSKIDLLKAIDWYWKDMKDRGIKRVKDKNRFHNLRTHIHKKRDSMILDLYTQSRKELGLKKGDLKEVKIASYLNKEHGFKLEPENVKVIAHRYLKKSNS